MRANISPINSDHLRHVFFDISRMGVKALEIMVLEQLQDRVLCILIEFQCKKSLATKKYLFGPMLNPKLPGALLI